MGWDGTVPVFRPFGWGTREDGDVPDPQFGGRRRTSDSEGRRGTRWDGSRSLPPVNLLPPLRHSPPPPAAPSGGEEERRVGWS